MACLTLRRLQAHRGLKASPPKSRPSLTVHFFWRRARWSNPDISYGAVVGADGSRSLTGQIGTGFSTLGHFCQLFCWYFGFAGNKKRDSADHKCTGQTTAFVLSYFRDIWLSREQCFVRAVFISAAETRSAPLNQPDNSNALPTRENVHVKYLAKYPGRTYLKEKMDVY